MWPFSFAMASGERCSLRMSRASSGFLVSVVVGDVVLSRAAVCTATRTRWGTLHIVPRVFAEADLLRTQYAVMKDAARARNSSY